jgi:hypothetical protein
MPDFKKTVATAKAKLADAETKAFTARLEAIDAILQGAPPHDVLMVCAHALAEVAPLCCEAHQDEFKADLLQGAGRVRRDAGEDATEPDESGNAPAQVH